MLENHLFTTVHEQLERSQLLEYKYLHSLHLMTRAVTHDYNNIFTGLAGQIKLITRNVPLGRVDDHRIELVTDLLERGIRKTSAFRDFSRYATGGRGLHSLGCILEDAVNFLNSISQSHTFTLQRPDSLPRLECCKSDVIMMIFYLGENAVEAMPDGGTITLTVSLDINNQDLVSIAMANTGVGIASPHLENVFKPFVSTKISSQGLVGLGLYAAKTIAEQHHGTLSVRDQRGAETVFTIVLPCQAGYESHNQPAEVIPEKATGSKHSKHRSTRQVFFVIEDDEAMRDLIVSGLQRRGHIVFSAESCSEAIEEFEIVHQTVTVIVIDVGLSDGDGFSCAAQMLRISDLPQVVFISGGEVEESEVVKYNAGYLKKPFTTKMLEDILHNAK